MHFSGFGVSGLCRGTGRLQLLLFIDLFFVPCLCWEPVDRRRTNVQQLTCNIDLSNSFYYLFFSFVLIELKPFVLKGKVLGEKF